MRDPTTEKFVKCTEVMATGDMTGPNRPVGRVTYTKESLKVVHAKKAGVGKLRFMNLQDPAHEEELFNVYSIDIDRSIGQDAGTCTIKFANQWTGTGAPEGVDTYMRPGYYTPGHGEPYTKKGLHSIYNNYSPNGQKFLTEWGYVVNKYRDVFIPNTILRTYQGYGSDNYDDSQQMRGPHDPGYIGPDDDSQLFQTGTWLIDSCLFDTSDQTITVQCRDLAKLLIEQYIYPPMIPIDRFPLIYCPAHGAKGHHGTPDKDIVGRNTASYMDSSVTPWFGDNASIYGHRATDAFDGNPHSYWLSVGNADPNAGYSFEWVQAHSHGKINEVYLHTKGSNYLIYVSVYENGSWQGTSTIPYNPNSPPAYPNGANIPYVISTTQGSSEEITISLPRTYDATRVRVTFTNLQDFGLGPFVYRAGLRTMKVRNHISVSGRKNTFIPKAPDGMVGKFGVRYISDWTEPVKELCAWAGFTWRNATPNAPDPLFGRAASDNAPLRVWGDFEFLGAGPIVCTPGDYFISKSFMDGIGQIRDFLGCIFFIDEEGGANFRLPNYWSAGNYITDPTSHFLNAKIKGHPIELNETANITDYQLTIDDSQVRSEVLVIGGYPNVHQSAPVAGGYVLGYNPETSNTSAIDFTDVLAGQHRLFAVPGDNSAFIYTERECQRMAELIALFILFSYRTGSSTAPAHPGLQLDDQIRIFERYSYEHYIHYVSGITTHMDLSTGEYSMQLTTNWLGEDPNTQWFVNKAQLTPAVTHLPAILKRIGREAGSDNFETPPYGV